MNTTFRVIKFFWIADDKIFREGLAGILENERDLEVAGESSSAAEALSLLNSATNVVVLDTDLGLECARSFVECSQTADFQARILVVTSGMSGHEAVRLVQAGVAGILHKRNPAEALCRAIRKVAAGDACLESEYLAALFQCVSSSRAGPQHAFTRSDRIERCSGN